MKTYLRSLGGRRVGGVIVAFTGPDRRDHYGNYWTQDTDFALQRYERRPLYLEHRGDMVEAGYIERDDVRLVDDGLYIEVDVLPNEAGDAILGMVERGEGHYSTGVMPGSWRARDSDGFVEFWPWVEASCTRKPATKYGLTRAALVNRSMGVFDDASSDEAYLRRGPIRMDEDEIQNAGENSHSHTQSNGQNGAAERVPTAEEIAQELLSRMRAERGQDEPPSRGLPAGALPEALRPSAGQVSVSHHYDGMSLGALALRTVLAQKAGVLDDKALTTAVRAMAARVGKLLPQDDGLGERELAQGSVRMFDAEARRAWEPFTRANEAMQSTFSGYGLQLVPQLLNTVAWYHFMLEAKVMNALTRIQLPSATYKWPIVTGGPTIRLVPQVADQANFGVHSSVIPATKIGTDEVTFVAKKIGALVLGSRELFEDSAVDVANLYFNQMLRQMTSAIDYIILNGDEGANVNNISHLGVDPTGTAYDKILACDGLRKMAFTATDTAAVVTPDIKSPTVLRKLMGTRGVLGLDPKRLAVVADPGVTYLFNDLAEYQSLADVGSQATLLTGQVGQIKGMPLIPSDELEATDAAGKIPSAHNGTKGSFLVVNRDLAVVGYRRELMADLIPVLGAEGFAAWTTVALDVQVLQAGAVAYGYNTTV